MTRSPITKGVLTLVVAWMWAPAAQAIPTFSRKLDLNCNACHSAWPALNEYGRKFKEKLSDALPAKNASSSCPGLSFHSLSVSFLSYA